MSNNYKFGDIFANGNGKFICTIAAETVEEAVTKYKMKELNPEKHVLSKQFGSNDDNASILVTDKNLVIEVLRLADCRDFDYTDIDSIPFCSKIALRDKLRLNSDKIIELRNEINNLEKENRELIDTLNSAVAEYDMTGKKMFESTFVQIMKHTHEKSDSSKFRFFVNIKGELAIERLCGQNVTDKQIVKGIHEAVGDSIAENTIYVFTISNKFFVIAVYDDEKATYVINRSVSSMKKFWSYAWEVAGIDPEKITNNLYGTPAYIYTNITNGMECVLPSGTVIKKSKNCEASLEKAVPNVLISKKEMARLFIEGVITVEQYNSLIALKDNNEESFNAYIKRNAKRIGFDINNIAQEMILTDYFENKCNFDMFGITTKVLKQLLTNGE